MNISKKDFLLYTFKNNYIKYANIINNMLMHIKQLHYDYIITNYEFENNMKILNNILTLLNNEYNNIKIDNAKNSAIIVKNIYEKYYDAIMVSLMKYESINERSIYNTIKTNINDLVSNIGSYNLEDLISLYWNNTIIITDEIKTLNKLFIPVKIIVKKEINAIFSNFISINASGNSDNYDMLINNCYDIIMNYNSIQLHITGYFKYDDLNIAVRTSKICDKYMYDKKNIIYNEIIDGNIKNIKYRKRISNISVSFRKLYLSFLTIGEILTYNINNFINIIENDYELFKTYSIINNFKQIFSEFIKINLKKKYNMIKLLLMNEDLHICNNAGFLFSLTKEHKNSSIIIADIIYKNLDTSLQYKLHKLNNSFKNELDKLNLLDSSDIDFKKQILLNKNIPQKVKKIALEKLEEMKAGNSEYYKHLQYVKIIAEFPWINVNNDDDIFSIHKNDINKWKDIMINTQTKLDKFVYGHNECKNTMIELIGKWFSNNKSMGKAIGLEGPPGVGKTLIAKGLGEALGIPLCQINLGGVDDGSILTGHSITYSGAVPGLIIKKITECGKSRCIMFFDELDKTCIKSSRNEIQDILIHAIDTTTNHEFNDKFFQDIQFPINKVLFIFSFNDRSKVDKILLDRMECIEILPYTTNDKIKITQDYMLTEIINDIGLLTPKIIFPNETLLYLIENFTFEAGVRDLKRKLEKIILKLNKDRIYNSQKYISSDYYIISNEIINTYLEKPQHLIKKIHPSHEVGIVNGLYATNSGNGGIIPILIYKNQCGKNGKFLLKLTGKQGSVMKESISYSFTIAINLVKQELCNEFFEIYFNGFHIHTPDASTPKDGPSAGSAFTLAFLSKILDKRIKNTIAMTGEIEINGNITAIGGLEFKLNGAKKSGIKLVFIPKENEKDLDKIVLHNKNIFNDHFQYKIVSHITEIFDYALIDDDLLNIFTNKNAIDSDITFEKLIDYKKYLNYD